MIAWYSSHPISEKIIISVVRGWKVPSKHTSLFHKEKDSSEAVLYGILRGCSDIIHRNFKNKIDYIHIDHGYINHHHFDGYYRFSLNDTQARYKNIDLPSDRAKKLNVELVDWVDNDYGVVLIIPPTAAICIFYGIDVDKWLKNIITKIGSRPYKIREKTDYKPLSEDLKIAKCVITFNSNSALEATIAGIPAIVVSNHSVIRDWNNLTLNNIEDCYEKSINCDRNKLINFVAYHQFTLDEVEKGIAPSIIKEMRKENVY